MYQGLVTVMRIYRPPILCGKMMEILLLLTAEHGMVSCTCVINAG